MLARYQIVRGKRPPDNPLPDGIRIDTRKHTRHFLRPEAEGVEALFRAPFDALAEQARTQPVYLGCNCPSNANPDLQRCHTLLALHFMRNKYPKLQIIFP